MNYFKKLFTKKEEKKKYLFTTRNLANKTANGDLVRREGGNRWADSFQSIENLIQSSSTNNTLSDVAIAYNTSSSHGGGSTQDPPSEPKKPEDPRKEVEPKAVFGEIKTEPLDISFENLDEKIKNVTERIDILKDHLDEAHLQDEHRALFYLKNRRKYMDTRKNYPIDWAMTTEDAVDHLCKTYKLKIVPLKQFYTLVPKEGVKEIGRYTKAYKAITGDEPIFELVIKDKPEQKPKEKKPEQKRKDRDPILLANSPLGNHLFVLGAWDDEVEIVDEIIYYGK